MFSPAMMRTPNLSVTLKAESSVVWASAKAWCFWNIAGKLCTCVYGERDTYGAYVSTTTSSGIHVSVHSSFYFLKPGNDMQLVGKSSPGLSCGKSRRDMTCRYRDGRCCVEQASLESAVSVERSIAGSSRALA